MDSGANENAINWQAFQQGDRHAFAAIYRQYFPNLYEYGVRLADDRDLVKDCIQDLFIKLWSNREQLGMVSNVKSYLLVALRGTIYNKLKQQQNTTVVDITDGHFFELTFSAETHLIEKEQLTAQSKKLLDALNNLTPRQKEVIYLKYFEELDYDEIAAILEISVKATYKLSARALEALREIMNLSASSLLMIISLAKGELFS